MSTPSDPALRRRTLIRRILGALATVFGLVTVVEGGHVMFGGPEARAAAGAIVPFVLPFNFAAGFLYVLAGLATLADRRPALWWSRGLAVATLLIFAALGYWISAGYPYETRTVVAMTLRSGFWVAMAVALPRLLTDRRRAG
jgi:hypothetical protein